MTLSRYHYFYLYLNQNHNHYHYQYQQWEGVNAGVERIGGGFGVRIMGHKLGSPLKLNAPTSDIHLFNSTALRRSLRPARVQGKCAITDLTSLTDKNIQTSLKEASSREKADSGGDKKDGAGHPHAPKNQQEATV